MNCDNCPRRETCVALCATMEKLADIDRVARKDWQTLTPHVAGLDNPEEILTVDNTQPASIFPEYDPSYWVSCDLWTPREQDCFNMHRQGMSFEDIGEKLGIDRRTAFTFNSRAMKKAEASPLWIVTKGADLAGELLEASPRLRIQCQKIVLASPLLVSQILHK